MNEATKTFQAATHAATDVATHTVKGARGGLFSALKTVVEVTALLRGIGADQVLSKVGLARKRSPLTSVGIFAAGAAVGAAVGAGIGLLLAPRSGRQTRRYLSDRLQDVGENVKTKTLAAVDQVEEKVGEVIDKAEDAVLLSDEGTDEPKAKKSRRNVNADKLIS